MFDENVSTISFNRRCLATAAQWHDRQHVEHTAKTSYLASTLRVSAPDGEIKVDPALVEYLYRFLFVMASEGNFQCLKQKVGAF